ncbi:MAG: hypothetical protein HRU26_07045 [Psychroserpens sp.]|nr:hypothetical protein [Psychroserpens sp.]
MNKVVDSLSIEITPQIDELAEFLEIVKGMMVASEEVAIELQSKEMYAESSKLFKSILKLELYLNPDGYKKSKIN